MRYFTPRAFSTRDPRTGRTATAPAGGVITQSVYSKLSRNLIERCGIIPLRNRPRNGEFTRDEFMFLVKGYLSGQSREDVVAGFYQSFPNHVVNDGPLCQLFIIRGMDTTNDYVGFQHPAARLVSVCQELNPVRFGLSVPVAA